MSAALKLDNLPEIISGDPAPEVLDRCPEMAEFLRLRSELEKAVADLRSVASRGPAAVQADRDALAAALASGKKDPGDKGRAALVAEAEAARRRVDGFNLAHVNAYNSAKEAIAEHAETWERELDAERREAAARLDELAAETLAVFASAYGPRQAQEWIKRATDPYRTWGGLPAGLSGGSTSVVLGNQPWSVEQVLDALKQTI